jgi:hypothetical protein
MRPTYVSLRIQLKITPKVKSQAKNLMSLEGDISEKNTPNNDFSTENAFQRNLRHLYFERRRHIELHMPIAIVLTNGAR